MNITGSNIAPTGTVRTLGVMSDSEMSMKDNVSSIKRCSAYPQLKTFKAIKSFHDKEAYNTATHTVDMSCLDAENSILCGIAQC